MSNQLNIDRIETQNLRAQNLESPSANINMLRSDTLEVRVIEAKNGQIEIQCTHDWNNQVDISRVDISDADFIKILRSKIKLTVSKNDPLYLSAVGKMVVE